MRWALALWALIGLASCLTEFPKVAQDVGVEDATPPTGDATATTDARASDAAGRLDAREPAVDVAFMDARVRPTDGAVQPDAAPPPGPDGDGDGVPDAVDNCPRVANPDQTDLDFDGEGDTCDLCPNGGVALDADGDGVRGCNGDCNDAQASVFPDAAEYCDGLDNDCDNDTDEDFATELGQPCTVGQGECVAHGHRVCAPDGRGTICDASPGAPTDELCNLLDDNCDGAVDEGVPDCCQPGDTRPCGQDVGICTTGTQGCDAGGTWSACDGVPPVPEESCDGLDNNCDGAVDEGVLNACLQCGPVPEEICDGLDNNCDLHTDEGFDVGALCITGVGSCARDGVKICHPNGHGTICDAQPGDPSDELCNGFDDNCDGRVDEGLDDLGTCSAGIGACANEGRAACGADGLVVCGALPRDPGVEICNGIDDDCDGETDEDFTVGAPCIGGLGICQTEGVQVCDVLGGVTCDAVLPSPGDETCNGLDDNCDGVIDEGATCGPYVAQTCHVWLVWADGQPAQPAADTWDQCPAAADDDMGAARCTSSRYDTAHPNALFWDMHVQGDMNGGDQLGVGFTCADARNPDLASWIQSHCALYLGWADTNGGPGDGAAAWGPCPAEPAGESGVPIQRCTSSGLDGRFHAFFLGGTVGDDDDLGVAFRCGDAADPGRAAGLQSSVRAWLAYDQDSADVNGGATWGDCPGSERDNTTKVRCVSTHGDGLFHAIDVGAGNNTNYTFGMGLSSR